MMVNKYHETEKYSGENINQLEHIDNSCDNKQPLEEKTRNDRLFLSAQYLMLASTEILPLSPDLSQTFYDLGDVLLKDMTNEEKMSTDEMEDVLTDLLGDVNE